MTWRASSRASKAFCRSNNLCLNSTLLYRPTTHFIHFTPLHSSRTLLLLCLPRTDSSTNISTSFPVLETPRQSNKSKESCFYDFEVPMGQSV